MHDLISKDFIIRDSYFIFIFLVFQFFSRLNEHVKIKSDSIEFIKNLIKLILNIMTN